MIKEHEVEKRYKRALQEKEEDSSKRIFSFVGYEDNLLEDYYHNVAKIDNSIDNRLICITPGLTKLVPLEGEEVILLAAQTGDGKSTVAANIVEPILAQDKKVLYISTEESFTRILNRLVALRKNWVYNEQNMWSDKMRTERNDAVKDLINSKLLTIIDLNTRGVDKDTGDSVSPLSITNLDNLKTIMESTIRDELEYDLLVLDYITKIRKDGSHGKAEWQVIMNTMAYIEEWCKKTNTPAVVFCQLKTEEDAKSSDFQTRIKQSKQLYDAVSFAVELNTNREDRTTEWKCHKNRNYGNYFRETLKFEKGRYVDVLDTDEEDSDE